MSYLRNGSTDAVTTRSYRRVRSSRLRDNADSDQIIATESSYGRKSYDSHGGSNIEYSRQVKTETKISGLGGPTQKSSLVQSMTANFERAKTHSTEPQSLNGNDRKATSNNNNNNAVSSPTVKVSDDNEEDRNEPPKKSAAASRRGRLQREKRMLRQKRRSTGVVSLKDLEDGKVANDESKEDKDLQRETEINTQQNEFTSPKSSTSSSSNVTSSSSNMTSSPSRTSKANEASAAEAARTVTDLSSSMVKQQHQRGSSNNVEDKHNDISKYRQRSSHDDFRHNSALSTTTPSPYSNKNLSSSKKNEDKALAELKEKLFLSEATVTRLKDAMHNMEQDLRKLEDDNGKLRRKNKLLEDENMTMLRLIRARDFE